MVQMRMHAGNSFDAYDNSNDNLSKDKFEKALLECF